jgi:hypothetical protein
MYLAYLDAGSGSQLVMAIVAGFAGVMVVLKLWWRRVLGLFRRKPAEAQTEAPATADTAAPVGTDREH